MIYLTREDQVRAEYTEEEIINMIKTKYQERYNPNSNLDALDQLLICESVAEAVPIRDNFNRNEPPDENVNVIGNGNDSYKRRVNFELTPDKLQVVSKLKNCRYFTPPVEVAQLLEEFFRDCGTKQGWWLSIAQQWTPRTINRVIVRLIKLQTTGFKSIQNPAAYFTFLIKKRKPRRNL